MTDSPALVLVTGANSGLGFAVAQELAANGDYRVLVAARTVAKSESPIGQLLTDAAFPVDPNAVVPLALDLSGDESITAAARAVTERFGSLDILINSAGVSTGGPELGVRVEFRFVFETNVFGAAALIEAFLPLLRASTLADRRIVNVASGAGQIGLTLGPTRTRFGTGDGKEVHVGARPIIRAAIGGDPASLNGTLVADEFTDYGW